MRHDRFTFAVDKAERAMITALAERLERSQSDAVRFVVLRAVRELEQQRPVTSVVEPKAVAQAEEL